MIIITAGHIDHGKTSLIKALTGTDADRLPEEKRRGMTIDLGFATLGLPNGTVASFVDVPGHHKFVANMIAGAAGSSCAVLVVACDDGVMPQTREHMKIIESLGVSHVCVALTKCDAVSDARIDETRDEADALLAATGYSGAPIVPVSVVSGTGIDEIREAIFAMAAACGSTSLSGGFRMTVDRVFAVKGAGLVVTGTVHSGSAAIGDTLMVSPEGLTARVRGIQSNGADVPQALAGGRYAINLAGQQLEKDALRRGSWLVDLRLHVPTRAIDIELTKNGEPISIPAKGRAVHLHLGADDLPARVWRITQPSAGYSFLHCVLERETTAMYGDRVVLRDHGGTATLGGARVIYPHAPARRWKTPERLAILHASSLSDWRQAFSSLLDLQAVDIAAFAKSRNLTVDEVAAQALTAGATLIADRKLAVGASLQTRICNNLVETIAEYHESRPNYFGPSIQVLTRRGLDYAPDAILFALSKMVADSQVVTKGPFYRLSSHLPAFSQNDRKRWTQVSEAMESSGLRPPQTHELARSLEWDEETLAGFLKRAEQLGLVSLVAPRRYFSNETLLKLGDCARAIVAEGGASRLSVAEFGRRTGTGRNLAVHILEFFDRIGLTQRTGNARVLRAEPEAIFAPPTIETDH